MTQTENWVDRLTRRGSVCDWMVGVPPLNDMAWHQRWNRAYLAVKEFDERGDGLCERLVSRPLHRRIEGH